MKKLFGFLMMVWAAVFAEMETSYFGHNWFPASIEEWFCDITALFLTISEAILFWQKSKK